MRKHRTFVLWRRPDGRQLTATTRGGWPRFAIVRHEWGGVDVYAGYWLFMYDPATLRGPGVSR